VREVREAVVSSAATGDLAVTLARQVLLSHVVYPVGTLTDLYVDAYAVGAQQAQVFATTVEKSPVVAPPTIDPQGSIDWSSWTPGDIAGAQALLAGPDAGYGLRQLLSQADVTIKSISDNRIGDLAQAIADNIASGATNSDLSAVVATILDDPARADMVAATEVTRSLVSGEYDQYTAMGVQFVAFLSAEDTRVCVLCQENEDQGALPITQDFVNGAPPTHPNCRCTIVPM
jgi:SPP1 gp7 family putative phage head morphogenesis protein